MIKLYEENHIKVDAKMIGQYLQDKRVTKSFSNYYDLFDKYRSDYQIDDILAGTAGDKIKNRAKAARYDERLSLLGLILDRVGNDLKENYYIEQILTEELTLLRDVKTQLSASPDSAVQLLNAAIAEKKRDLDTGKKSNSLSDDKRRILHGIIKDLEAMVKALAQAGNPSGDEAFFIIRKDFNTRRAAYKEQVEEINAKLDNMFTFAEEVFADGQEMLIIVTELTKGFYSAHYISRHGCTKYFQHNKELLFYERQNDILKELEGVDI